MLKSSYRLGTLFGIPVYLDLSLIILAAYMVQAYGSLHEGVAAGLLLLVSITLHEFGHSLTARAFGCHVRDITLMVTGGRATLSHLPRRPWQELLVAAAGPAVSLLLGLAGVLGPLFLRAARLLPEAPAAFLTYALGVMNLVLFGFNLLPAFPMDGGRILRALLQLRMSRVRATWIASRIGRLLAGLMIFFALCNIFRIPVPKPPLPGLAGNLIWWFLSSGTFLKLLLGWMLFNAAEREYRQVLQEEGGGRQGPFAGFPFFGRTSSRTPPPDDGRAVVSPPPYARGGATRIDVHKED